jgi:precorrin-6B methylase 2
MSNFFDSYPEFINDDVRKNRISPDDGYPVDAVFLDKRWSLMLPADKCLNKNILDLGSCTASVGAWCLHNGASTYTGIELQSKFVNSSRANLEKYFPNRSEILESTVEDFLEKNTKHFDIVIASGILYGVSDLYQVLRKLAQVADHIVVESRHPPTMRQMLGHMPRKIEGLVESFECKHAIIDVNEVPMVYEEENKRARTLGFVPSIGALVAIYKNLDFVPDLSVYENLKQQISEVYGIQTKYARYAVSFHKGIARDKLHFFADVYKSPEILKSVIVDYQNK